MTAASIPWLFRWLLLRDAHHHGQPPGEDEFTWVHVVCPKPRCKNDGWETLYELETVTQCGLHDGLWIPMKPCPMCQRAVGFHSKPEAGQ
jgi:hypothetical protein